MISCSVTFVPSNYASYEMYIRDQLKIVDYIQSDGIHALTGVYTDKAIRVTCMLTVRYNIPTYSKKKKKTINIV